MTVNLEGLPPSLLQPARRRFVNWRHFEIDGRLTKLPCLEGGHPVSVVDPRTPRFLGPYLKRNMSEKGYGLGLILLDDEDIVAIDLDHCVDESGVIDDFAMEIVSRFQTWAEISVSGTGIHMLTRGSWSAGNRATVNGLHVEVYPSKRYITLSGDRVPGTPPDIEEGQGSLDWLASLFPVSPPANSHGPFSTNAFCDNAGPNILLDEDGVLELVESDDRLRSLLSGDLDSFDGDRSRMDLALANYLVSLMGRNPDGIKGVMVKHGPVREKWFKNKGYLDRTIMRAIGGVRGADE